MYESICHGHYLFSLYQSAKTLRQAETGCVEEIKCETGVTLYNTTSVCLLQSGVLSLFGSTYHIGNNQPCLFILQIVQCVWLF